MMREPPEPTAPVAQGSDLESRASDLVIRLAFLGLFVYWSLILVRPFVLIVIWAVVLAAAIYPAYAWLARRSGWPGLSALIVTVLLLATILGPISVLATSMVQTANAIVDALNAGTLQVPPPPSRVEDWPLVGAKVHEVWSLVSSNLDDAITRYGPAMLPAGATVLTRMASIGGDLLKMLVSMVLMGFMLKPGPRLAAGAKAFAGRLVAPQGAHFVGLAGATIRSVSRGVVGVALLQTLIAGIVLEVAGVPGAGLLAFAILIFCIIQIGPAPVLVPVVIWAWITMSGGSALILTLVLAPIMVIDNVLKPILKIGRAHV